MNLCAVFLAGLLQMGEGWGGGGGGGGSVYVSIVVIL